MLDPKLLKSCALFAGLEDDDLAQVASVTSLRECDSRETVITEGDRARAFYVVLSGAVRVYKASLQGKEQVLRFARPGEVFGEAAAFALGYFPASAEATAATRLLVIDAEGFQRLLAEQPRLSVNVILTLYHRLEELVGIVEALSLQEVGARVAKYLLDLSIAAQAEGRPAVEVELPVKKGELAARLGTTAESLSRSFAKLREAGTAEVRGRRVRILDHEALEAAAAGL